MNKVIIVREYARLTTGNVERSSLDVAQVSVSAFDYLCALQENFKKNGASLLQIEGRRWLKLDNYVGVLQTPCGTVIEILPKKIEGFDEENDSRNLLIKMLKVALDLPVRLANKANIQLFKHPLLEWVMKEFVLGLDHVVKRGLRFDYHRIEEEQLYLCGQLNINMQLRQPPGREHIFNIRHDLYLPDRAENRLLKTALIRVCKLTQQPDTWRLAHELAGIMTEVPISQNILQDFRLWQSDRLMAHYQPVRKWCELVLGQHMPLAMQGVTQGISLLFPMERLFETFVEQKLRKQLPSGVSLKSQSANQYLCEHDGGRIFQLRPDLMIVKENITVMVLDTKWKLISSMQKNEKYGLSQSDFYQLFAYGQKYMGGKGELMLIYPLTFMFKTPLDVFSFSESLKLWVVPFDLENEKLILPSSCRYAQNC